MDRHVASLLAMTNKKRFIGLATERLGVRLGSRNDCVGGAEAPRGADLELGD
jgi:hypothetical protein